MATKRLGKLKYNISKRGIAYKWGDGEIHRFSFERFQRQPDDEPEEQPPVDEESHEEGYAYGDTGYEDGYEDQPQGEYDEYADEEYAPSGFLYANEWLMWLLLIVLPPLGIWILWKRNQYEKPLRSGISAVSAVWFIVLIILLISGIAGNKGDTVVNQTDGRGITLLTPAPTVAAQPTIAAAAPTASVVGQIGTPTLPPTSAVATPKPDSSLVNGNTGTVGTTGTTNPTGTTGTTGTTDEYVYFTVNGEFYHTNATCSNMTDAGRGLKVTAQGQGKTACPVCYGVGIGADGTTGSATGGGAFYATSGGKYYHTDKTCTGMKNATVIAKTDAEARGQTPCPVCIGYYATKGGTFYHVKSDCTGMKNAELTSLATCTSRGQTACPVCIGGSTDTNVYYHTRGGEYYHTDKTCSNMKNATQTTLTAAVASGQSACPVCVRAAGGTTGVAYYATDAGKYYHTDKTCTGMKNAKQVTTTAAAANGKTACPVCVGTTSSTSTKVYYTAGGTYYHKADDCSGMKNPVAGSVAEAKAAGKTACPTCIARSGSNVYCTANGTYYHIVSDCTGMKNASYVTLEKATRYGKTACPTCIGATGGATGAATTAAEVYCTANGTYYHTNKTCTGMKNAKGTTVAAAVAAGKRSCPTCVGTVDTTAVYSTKYGTYYHDESDCSGMTGAKKTTVSAAIADGKSACPVCIGTTDTKVYCTKDGTYYHIKSNCSGMTGATFVTLKTAIAASKTACPNCIGADGEITNAVATENLIEDTGVTNTGSGFTVYCTPAGTYYHTAASCSGSGMSGGKATTLASASAAGKLPCPDCVNASNTTRVFATDSSRYYHTNSACSGIKNASIVTIALAKANGKTACPTCAGGTISTEAESDGEKVYCTANGTYYHKTANCSGMKNASAVTKTKAVTYGKVACPECYGGTSGTNSSLTKVYCTAGGTYYHVKATCSGMSGAKSTTAAAAKSSGKEPCPVCINTSKSTRVFCNNNDNYYHTKSICEGETNGIITTYTLAVAAGKTGCPDCTGSSGVTKTIKVYATPTSVYYHSTSKCTREDIDNASYVTVTKAQNYGKTACPKCMSDE